MSKVYCDFEPVSPIRSHLRIRILTYMKSIRMRIWKIRQQYFAVHGVYADRHNFETTSANFWTKSKMFQNLNHLPRQNRMSKKLSHATVPLKTVAVRKL
jgi:hypothetical protein